ncbi:MAG: hypothetical protein HOO86_16530 [Bacteroidales bacterium]|nr:hypothetical protein [Bacteroidales bacterium]
MFILFQTFAFAQQPTKCDYVRPHEADMWTFGQNALIDFSQGDAIPGRMGTGNIDLFYGCASISDVDGNLLFFSDGKKLYSNGFYLLDNTNDLKGNVMSAQSSLFVPTPGNADKYYVFSVDYYIPNSGHKGIYYSVIERVGGLWNVTSKNQLLFEKNAQKITAVKQKNLKDYWVIIHGYDTEGGNFMVYQLTDAGLDPTPITINTGVVHTGTGVSFANNGGYMKASPDGSKIALVVPNDGIIEVFNFNTENGLISIDKVSAAGAFNSPYGLEFSPDNSKLYVTTTTTGNLSCYLYQFDLNNPECFTNYSTIYELADVNRNLGALQLGIDGKIYVANYLEGNYAFNTLNVIENPDRIGDACNFKFDAVPLAAITASYTGLPNFVTSFLDIPHFTWINQCHTQITYFNLRNETNVGTPLWDFDDNGATSNDLQSNYTFSQPGNYTVSVTENYGGNSYAYERDITIHPLPPVELGDPVLYILPGSSVTLDAGEFDEYLWDPDGSTERYIDVSQEGIYKVTVTDTNCCVNEDQIEIKFAKIYFPTAFKPESSVVENKTFKTLGATSALLNFSLNVYNRWGQMVFSSHDPDKGWDGTFSGGDAPTGVYVWVVSFNSTESRYQSALSITERGTVTLLR